MNLSYRELLTFAASNASEFTLVWRKGLEFSQSARDIDQALQPYLIRKEVSSKWPGTELLSGAAVVKRYKVTEGSLAILHAVDDTFGWISPEYPEDLAFYSGEKLLFGSIAHEEIAWFE